MNKKKLQDFSVAAELCVLSKIACMPCNSLLMKLAIFQIKSTLKIFIFKTKKKTKAKILYL